MPAASGNLRQCFFRVRAMPHRTLGVLCCFTLLWGAVTLGLVWLRPNDSQIYTLFTNLLSGYAGALLMYLTGGHPPPPAKP
jgi:hypothetical protein